MDYDKAKTILKNRYRTGKITQKQYFNLVSQARAKYLVKENKNGQKINEFVVEEKDDLDSIPSSQDFMEEHGLFT